MSVLPSMLARTVISAAARQAHQVTTSRWSPAERETLRSLSLASDELVRAYKTPSLRSVADRAPYMHAGQLATLTDVVAHYDRAPAAPFGHSELKPLRLSTNERRQLEVFLRYTTLTAQGAQWLPRGA